MDCLGRQSGLVYDGLDGKRKTSSMVNWLSKNNRRRIDLYTRCSIFKAGGLQGMLKQNLPIGITITFHSRALCACTACFSGTDWPLNSSSFLS